MNTSPDSTAWATAMASLSAAGDRLAGIMRERGGEADAAGVYATMLGALMDVYLNQIAVQREHPVFAPCTGYFQRGGTPNPDTVYRCAPIDATGVYRIVGNRKTARDVTLMAFSAAMRSWPPVDLSSFSDGPDGAFDILASAERPEDYAGHWLRLEPGMASLWLRSVSDRWDQEEDPWIAITRLDGHARERMSEQWLADRLAGAVMRVERMVEYGIRHADELATAGFVNKLKQIDYSAQGGMPLQSYHEGMFKLAEDQALLVEARMPPECGYFSWSLTDAMFVTLDWTNAHTSINSGQAAPDADGVLRVIVSERDPGVPNWLQTTGYKTGVLQCRTVGSAQAPEMSVELIPVANARNHFPAGTETITPEGRRQMLQERQISAQMRRLW